jgi:hypothetical protein
VAHASRLDERLSPDEPLPVDALPNYRRKVADVATPHPASRIQSNPTYFSTPLDDTDEAVADTVSRSHLGQKNKLES